MRHWTILTAVLLCGCASWTRSDTTTAVLLGGQLALLVTSEEDPSPEDVQLLVDAMKAWAAEHVDPESERYRSLVNAADVAIATWERYGETGQGDWRSALQALMSAMLQAQSGPR